MLNLKEDLKFDVVEEPIEWFCQRRKSLGSFFFYFVLIKGESQMPSVFLDKDDPSQSGSLGHMAILEKNPLFRKGTERFIKVKNSDNNEPSIEINLDSSKKRNDWYFDSDTCLYLVFK